MSALAWWSVIDIVALIAGLAIYLYIVGSQLKAIAADLQESADLVWQIKADAEAIEPGLRSINTTGRADHPSLYAKRPKSPGPLTPRAACLSLLSLP